MITFTADLIQALSVITFLPFDVFFLIPLATWSVSSLHFSIHISILLDLKKWKWIGGKLWKWFKHRELGFHDTDAPCIHFYFSSVVCLKLMLEMV